MSENKQEFVDAGTVPGLALINDKVCGQVGGQWFPVRGVLRTKDGGYIPVLDIPQMKDVPAKKAAV